MPSRCRILLISGSLRAGSTNSALLRTAQSVAPEDVDAVPYDGMAGLPHFNPDDDPEGGPVDPAIGDLRARIGAADALLFCTPEYAGALPGSFKNLLDWTVGGGETYAMPVGWVNVSGPASPSGASGAHDSLRCVLTYTGSQVVEAACVRIPVARGAIGDDGLIDDPHVREGVAGVLQALAGHVANASAP